MFTLDNVYPVSNSRLGSFQKSPLHLHHHMFQPKEETYAQKIGKAFHCCILEPEEFEATYIKAPQVDRRTKEGKATYSEFAIKNINKTIINEDDYDKLLMMKDGLYKSSVGMDILNEIQSTEVEKLWTNEETGINMRGFIDAIGSNFLLELKTTQDADPLKFQRDAMNYGYNRQAAVYLDSDEKFRNFDFYFIAIEKEAPHGISIHKCSKDLINHGREKYITLLKEYKTWVERGMPIKGYEYWNFNGINDWELAKYYK